MNRTGVFPGEKRTGRKGQAYLTFEPGAKTRLLFLLAIQPVIMDRGQVEGRPRKSLSRGAKVLDAIFLLI